ncbi:hypothetical protein ACEWY4_027728 [Coilia grayii]|uniref:Methyltransferase like 8 n=1 Tax=Coilia grayii TaxID=363190 RepID=A0ABD1INW3_9TELE
MRWWCRVPLAVLAHRGCCHSPRRPMSAGGRPPVPLGGRLLTNPDCVFQHNMWDHVQWSEEDTEEARRRAEENSSERVPQEEQAKYERDASHFWDGFYKMHQNKFFKDRRWLFQEFPELLPPRQSSVPLEGDLGCAGDVPPLPAESPRETEEGQRQKGSAARSVTGGEGKEIPNGSCAAAMTQEVQPKEEGEVRLQKQEVLPTDQEEPGAGENCGFPGDQASFRILEVGCGAGNSVFPIISAIRERGGFLYCCDFSSRAVKLVKVRLHHPSPSPRQHLEHDYYIAPLTITTATFTTLLLHYIAPLTITTATFTTLLLHRTPHHHHDNIYNTIITLHSTLHHHHGNIYNTIITSHPSPSPRQHLQHYYYII